MLLVYFAFSLLRNPQRQEHENILGDWGGTGWCRSNNTQPYFAESESDNMSFPKWKRNDQKLKLNKNWMVVKMLTTVALEEPEFC